MLVVKNPPANAGDVRDASSIPGLGRSSGEGNGHLLQYSCLENPIDRGAWGATVHRIAQSWTRLKRFSSRTQWAPEHLWGKCSCTVHKPFLRKEKKASQVHWTGTSPFLGYRWEVGRGACPSNWECCWLWNPGGCFCLRSHTLHLQSVFWSVIPPPFRAAEWQLTVAHSEMCSENNRMMKGAGSNLGGKEKGGHKSRGTTGFGILQTEKGYACVYVLRGRGISTVNNTRHGNG